MPSFMVAGHAPLQLTLMGDTSPMTDTTGDGDNFDKIWQAWRGIAEIEDPAEALKRFGWRSSQRFIDTWPDERQHILWHANNTIPISFDEWTPLNDAFDTFAATSGLTERLATISDSTEQGLLWSQALSAYEWETRGWVPNLFGSIPRVCRPTTDVPAFMLARYSSIAATDLRPKHAPGSAPSGDGGRSVTPKPVISPAFIYDGRQGLGRISSSQISLALFTACVAPKSEWSATAKGFPRYVFTVPSGEIVVTLTPDVMVRGDLADQVAQMVKLRDELSIDDWELLTILMEQVFTEGHSGASAFMTNDAALNYRQIEPKRKGGYNAGHRPEHRARIDACLNHIAHLHIRTDTLRILEDTGTGKPRLVPVDWNEKVIKISGDITRRDNDAAMGWSYEFGRTFTTFLKPPNNFVGYLLQGTVALDGRKGAAKHLAHYLTLHTRIDASNGRGMVRSMGELVDGARLPHYPTRQQRTIDYVEDALREVVKAGLYRFEHGGKMFDANSADLDAWTAVPKDARGHGLLNTWRRQKVVIRANHVIEARYDRYRKQVPRHTPS